jgi:hypothetical protein
LKRYLFNFRFFLSLLFNYSERNVIIDDLSEWVQNESETRNTEEIVKSLPSPFKNAMNIYRDSREGKKVIIPGLTVAGVQGAIVSIVFFGVIRAFYFNVEQDSNLWFPVVWGFFYSLAMVFINRRGLTVRKRKRSEALVLSGFPIILAIFPLLVIPFIESRTISENYYFFLHLVCYIYIAYITYSSLIYEDAWIYCITLFLGVESMLLLMSVLTQYQPTKYDYICGTSKAFLPMIEGYILCLIAVWLSKRLMAREGKWTDS